MCSFPTAPPHEVTEGICFRLWRDGREERTEDGEGRRKTEGPQVYGRVGTVKESVVWGKIEEVVTMGWLTRAPNIFSDVY